MSLGYPIFANNLWATLANPAAATDLTLTLTAGQGARFPVIPAGCWLYVTLVDASNDLEVVAVISVSGDVLTVERAADNTNPRAWAANSRVEARFNVEYLADVKNYINQTLDAGGYMMTGPMILTGGPGNVNDLVPKSWVDAALFQKTTPWMAPVGFPMVPNWTANLFSQGWTGSYCDLSVDSTLLGHMWTSANFNPAAMAPAGSMCNWGSGIVEIGYITDSGGSTLDNGGPWLLEGMREPNGGTPGLYLRSAYLKNTTA